MPCKAEWTPNPNFLIGQQSVPRTCKEILCEIKALGGFDQAPQELLEQFKDCQGEGSETVVVTIVSSSGGDGCPAANSPIGIERGCLSITPENEPPTFERFPETGAPTRITIASGTICRCDQGNGNSAIVEGGTFERTDIFFDYQLQFPDTLEDLDCEDDEEDCDGCGCCDSTNEGESMATCQDLVNAITALNDRVAAVAINIDAQRAEIICLEDIMRAAFVNREVKAKHYANQEVLLNELREDLRNALRTVQEAINATPLPDFETETILETSDELLAEFPECSTAGVYCPPGQIRNPTTGLCEPIGGNGN